MSKYITDFFCPEKTMTHSAFMLRLTMFATLFPRFLFSLLGGIVLSTLREAADKDSRISVLSDCCADADSEVHNILMLKVFPRQSDVFTLDEWTRK